MRILLIAHDFPPLNTSAARRPYSWAVAWSAQGHDVHVVTTSKYRFDGHVGLDLPQGGYQLSEVSYLPDRYRLSTAKGAPVESANGSTFLFEFVKHATRRLRLGLGLMTQTPMLALPYLVRECLKEHRHKPFDVVISTSGPEVCTFAAYAFAKRAGVPWIADYRDLWFREFAVRRYVFTTWLTGVLNRYMLRKAAAVVTVSDGLAGYLRPIVRCPVWVCYNGYLDRPLRPPRPRADGRVHIVYTGNFYPEKRDPRPFFAAMSAFLKDRPEFRDRLRLDLYGPSERWVQMQVEEFGLFTIVADHGMQPYSESLRAQVSADALLFVDWMDLNAKGVLTGKLFEYIAAGAPILNVTASGDTEASRIIRETTAGDPLVGEQAIARALLTLVTKNEMPPVNQAAITRYSRFAQAETLLRRVTKLVSTEERDRSAAGGLERRSQEQI